jgi:hypothetical protein
MNMLDMRCKVRRLEKRESALFASEAAFAAMRRLVTIQVTGMTELLPAIITCVHLPLLVHKVDVTLQVAPHFELLVAERASMFALDVCFG